MFNARYSIKSLVITGQIFETDFAKLPCSGVQIFLPYDVNEPTNSLELKPALNEITDRPPINIGNIQEI
jgi:hypothetical protein